MSKIRWAGIVGMLVAHLLACSSEHRADDRASLCRDVHDHVAELELASSRTPSTSPDVERAHRAALERAMSPGELDECRSESAATLRCMLNAEDLHAATRCGTGQ